MGTIADWYEYCAQLYAVLWGAFHKKIMSDRFSTKTALCTKIREVATILPNMSENYQEIKPWQGLKIFENL